jgi:hypothetical protein
VSRASTTKRPTSVLLFASAVMTVSAFLVRSASTWFWRARMESSLSVSRIAGTPRRIATLRSLPRAASPVPNSLRMIRRRSRWGRRRMLLTTSGEIVDWVWLTGIVEPGFSRCGLLPGWQSMKYSPISDWGRLSHCTSVRSSLKSDVWATSNWTSAFLARRSIFMSVIFPARTPAIFMSAPLTRPKALSSCTQ